MQFYIAEQEAGFITVCKSIAWKGQNKNAAFVGRKRCFY